MRLFLGLVVISIVLAGCVQQAAEQTSPLNQVVVDSYFSPDPVYLTGLQPLTKTGAQVKVKASLVNNSLYFQDFYNPLVNATSREITNPNQPSIIEFNIINNKSDLFFGSLVVESELEPRNSSASLVFANILSTSNVFPQGQGTSGASYLNSNKNLTINYSKVPFGEGFVVYMVFFPTWIDQSPKGFMDFFKKNQDKSVRFYHSIGNESRLILEIRLVFE